VSMVWVIIFCLYAVGWFFEDSERREIALQICFLSCLTCVVLVRFPELNYSIAPFGFAFVDLIAFALLFSFRFKVLSLLVGLSFLCHVLAGISLASDLPMIYYYYSHIMIAVNIGILSVLFINSRGSHLVMQCCRGAVALMPSSQCRKDLARLENDIYTLEIMQSIERDFK